jgi:hypothetical protein
MDCRHLSAQQGPGGFFRPHVIHEPQREVGRLGVYSSGVIFAPLQRA